MPRKFYKPTGNPVGKPPHVPNDITRRLVSLGIGCRMEKQAIAAALGIHRDTLDKYYQEEFSAGKAMTDLFVADKMFEGIKNGDTALIKYYMNNQMGFKEKADVTVENNFTFATLAVPEINRKLAELLTRRQGDAIQAPVTNRPVLSIDGDAREV